MNMPTIHDAKVIATRTRARAAIVLTFGDGRFAVASYGHTREMCSAAATVVEAIAGLLESGKLEVPESLR